jgi:hypothetical protein
MWWVFGIALWLLTLVVVLALCRAAAAGDRAINGDSSTVVKTRQGAA